LTIYNREAFPEGLATTQNSLAASYVDRILGERTENLEKAIAGYQQALTVRAHEALPADCLETARNLGDIYLANQH
jgi:hypothetical protein